MDSNLLQNMCAKAIINPIMDSDNIVNGLSELHLPNEILYKILSQGLPNKVHRIRVWYEYNPNVTGWREFSLEFNIDDKIKSMGSDRLGPESESILIDFDPKRYVYRHDRNPDPYYLLTAEMKEDVVSIKQSELEGTLTASESTQDFCNKNNIYPIRARYRDVSW